MPRKFNEDALADPEAIAAMARLRATVLALDEAEVPYFANDPDRLLDACTHLGNENWRGIVNNKYLSVALSPKAEQLLARYPDDIYIDPIDLEILLWIARLQFSQARVTYNRLMELVGYSTDRHTSARVMKRLEDHGWVCLTEKDGPVVLGLCWHLAFTADYHGQRLAKLLAGRAQSSQRWSPRG